MMHTLKIARSARLPRLAVLLVAVAGLGLAGCDDHAGDPKMQIGANPVLPQVQQYLMPPMRVAKVVGWGKDETPKVAQGLRREREVEAVRARGYGEASGEREVGLHAIAVPVLDGRGELAAILGLQGPDRFDAEARSRALDPLRERAARLGAALST